MDKFAEVKSGFQENGVKWLGIEDKRSTKEGVFLLLYESINEPCKYDWWFQSIEEAFEFAEENYGVGPHDWETADNLRARGIEVIDEQ